MKARWQPTGWALSDAGGERIEYELHLPGHVKGVINRQHEAFADRDPILRGWYWWIGSDRTHRPDKWPGNGPYASQRAAKAACEAQLKTVLRQALAWLE